MNNIIGHRIYQARKTLSLNQAELAEKTGLLPSAISHLECGRRKPCAGNLVKLADALGVTTDFLLGRDRRTATVAGRRDTLKRW